MALNPQTIYISFAENCYQETEPAHDWRQVKKLTTPEGLRTFFNELEAKRRHSESHIEKKNLFLFCVFCSCFCICLIGNRARSTGQMSQLI